MNQSKNINDWYRTLLVSNTLLTITCKTTWRNHVIHTNNAKFLTTFIFQQKRMPIKKFSLLQFSYFFSPERFLFCMTHSETNYFDCCLDQTKFVNVYCFSIHFYPHILSQGNTNVQYIWGALTCGIVGCWHLHYGIVRKITKKK